MLKNTGERLILEQSWNLMTTLEHLHRYNAVSALVKDKVILDAACGTGYGSHLLSKYAKKVTGIDLSEDAIEYAKERYSNPNLEYKNMSITDIELPDNSLDAIVSFETIEHVTAECQVGFLEEVSRTLKKDGMFIVSTPNDQLLRDISFGSYENEFHLCELSESEFVELLKKYFPCVEIYYQTVTEVSSIVKKGNKENAGRIYSMADANVMGRYYIAVCSYKPVENVSLNSCMLPKPEEYFDERYFTKCSRVYLDMGEGYTGQDYVECKYVSRDGKKFKVEFSLADFENRHIHALRFDPCEYGARIKIESAQSYGGNMELAAANAEEKKDGYDVFMTLDPIYEIRTENADEIKKISISGEIDSIPNWVVIENQRKQYEKLQLNLEKERQSEAVLQEEIKQIKIHQEMQVETLNEQMETLKEQVRSLKEQLKYTDEVSKKRDENITYLSNELAGCNNRLNIAEKENSTLSAANDKLETEKQNLILQRKQLQNRFEEASRNYEAICNSSFWKATKPMRGIADTVKRISKKKVLNDNISDQTAENKTDAAAVPQDAMPKEIRADLLWNWDKEMMQQYNPLVSIIVPNYNHAPYLRERLDSIYNQTYSNYEVILLDDCSSDESRAILDEYAERYADRTQKVYNTENCGKPFRQWDKGIALASGELIWIAESDDYCEQNFLEEMVPLFKRESVMLAFARSVFMQDGRKVWSTEEYLSDLPELFWDKPFTMTAHNLVNVGFGIKNIIPNVSSAVFRNMGTFSTEKNPLWEQMKLCGDWVFYLNLIRGGCVSYTNKTTNYYRVHQKSTSLNVQKTETYYIEQCEVSKFVVRNYKVNMSIFETVLYNLKEHYKAIQCAPDGEIVEKYYKINEIIKEQEKRNPNILMACYSMKMGGGETYPLFLADEMKKEGLAVTVLDFCMDTYDKKVRDMLSANVPLVEIRSLDYFYQIVAQLGGEIIHSHHASVDEAIASWLNDNPSLKCKHVVCLHGMYEAIDETVCERTLEKVTKSCSKFIYTADKNLFSIKKFGYEEKIRMEKLPNGLPEKEVHPVDRSELGIGKNDFVLCLISRALPEKGWAEAVEAVKKANLISAKPIQLLLIGEGEMYDRLKNEEDPYVHFLGARGNIRDYLAMSDAGFLPSRFPGESYPLVVIDSLMCCKPVIATDLGEIKNQLSMEDGKLAGILLRLDDWKLDTDEMARVIVDLAENEEMYLELVNRARIVKEKFSIEKVVKNYLRIYKEILN